MADDLTKKISELERLAGDLTPESLLETAYTNDQMEGFASYGVSIEQAGRAILNDVEYATELDTDNKTIFGAINELAEGGGGGGGSTVTITDNPAGGVDLTVDGTTKTLANESDLDTIKDDLTDHETRIKALEQGGGSGGTVDEFARAEIAEVKSFNNENYELVISPNLFHIDEIQKGYYWGGRWYDSQNLYHVFIDVEAGWELSSWYVHNIDESGSIGSGGIYPQTMRFIDAYNASGASVSSASAQSVNKYTVPDGIVKICVTMNVNTGHSRENFTTIKKGFDKPVVCEAYHEPYWRFKGDLLEDVQRVAEVEHKPLRSFAKADSVTVGNYIKLELNNVKIAKCYSFLATLASNTKLRIGQGEIVYSGSYIDIDSTTVKQYNYFNGETLVATYEHGLTFASDIEVHIDCKAPNNTKLRLSSFGEWFEQTLENFSGDNGEPFVKVLAGSITNATFNFTCDGYTKDIQIYGDSYLGLTNPARWAYYLMQDGYNVNCLLDGFAGKMSGVGYTTFLNNLKHSKPKYALFLLGMNDNDSATELNIGWRSAVDSFVVTCQKNNIEPILATIPSAVGGSVADSSISSMRINKWKNAYVRNLGLRYIDFNKAVGASDATGEWYTGMLSSDGVHPTEKGARALYMQVLADFPEIMRR